MSTLTTANSAFTLVWRGLFPVPQALQGYGTDDSFTMEEVSPVETEMGVDGQLSGGYVPYPTTITWTFQADSPSIAMFDTVLAVQNANKEAVIADGTGIVQGTGDKYAMTKGYLTKASLPNAKKKLGVRAFTITFEKVAKAPS